MNYELRLVVPKSTTEIAPVESTLTVHPGVVREVNVLFPRGCAQLAHAQILRWGQQVWPSDPNQDFSGDGETIDFVEEFHVEDPPYTFTLRAWNDDDTFPHTITLRVAVLALDTTESGGVLKTFTEMFGRLLRGQV